MERKTKFYLDQNVIDYLIKDNLQVLNEILNQMHGANIVYSYVTMNEFARIKNDEERKPYLEFLKQNRAMYFRIDDQELAHFEETDPYTIFAEKNSGNDIYKSNEDAMTQMMQKVLGGKKDVTIEEIGNLQKDSFAKLMETILKDLDSVDDIPQVNKEELKKMINQMNPHFSSLIDNFTQQINQNDKIEDPLLEMKKLCNIHSDELNKIEPPNIVEKIWDKIKDGITNNNLNVTFDDLFGDKIGRFYPNQKFTMIMKVNGIYNMLNSLGYHTDKNFRNDRKFIPFVNDQQHAGLSIYADVFVTRDYRFMKKLEAVYEHLNIGTKIIFIE